MINLDDKVILRKPEISDVDQLFEVKNNKEANNMLGGFSTGYSKADIGNWIDFHNKQNNEVLYLIQDAKSEKVIGHVGLYNIDHRIRKAEFAILIADSDYWGKGIGKICTKYMVEYGFNELNLNRIELNLLASNERALSLYEKAGFGREGLLKQAQYKNGEYQDIILMAKFRY